MEMNNGKTINSFAPISVCRQNWSAISLALNHNKSICYVSVVFVTKCYILKESSCSKVSFIQILVNN